MTSRPPGAGTSEVEVTQIDRQGVWLYVSGAEYFLPHEELLWFREAKVSDVLDVVLLHAEHLHWPSLDVDLSVASLKDPDASPLKYE